MDGVNMVPQGSEEPKLRLIMVLFLILMVSLGTFPLLAVSPDFSLSLQFLEIRAVTSEWASNFVSGLI